MASNLWPRGVSLYHDPASYEAQQRRISFIIVVKDKVVTGCPRQGWPPERVVRRRPDESEGTGEAGRSVGQRLHEERDVPTGWSDYVKVFSEKA